MLTSADRAASRLAGARVVALTRRHDAGGGGDDEECRDREDRHAQSAVLSGLGAGALIDLGAFGVGEGLCGGEERRFELTQIGVSVPLPLECRLQPGAPVQLAVGTAHRVPCAGGGRQVSQEALPVGVLLEPRAQPRPRSRQRFVREADARVVGGHQAGAYQQVQHTVAVVDAAAGRVRGGC